MTEDEKIELKLFIVVILLCVVIVLLSSVLISLV